MPNRQSLIEANRVLSLILPGAAIRWSDFQGHDTYHVALPDTLSPVPLMLAWGSYRLSWRPQDPCLGRNRLECLAQLLRFAMGRKRSPLAWWRLAVAQHPESAAILDALTRTAYPDGATSCLFCGRPDPLDWWCHGPHDGPCCFAALCRRKESDFSQSILPVQFGGRDPIEANPADPFDDPFADI